MFEEIFKFLVYRIQENAFPSQKLKVDIFTPQAKFPPGFLSSPTGRGKLLIPIRQCFLENLFSVLKLGGGGGRLNELC